MMTIAGLVLFTADVIGLGAGNRGAVAGFSGDGNGVPGRGLEIRGITTVNCRGITRAGSLNDGDGGHWLASREVSLSKGFVKLRSSLRGVTDSWESECDLFSSIEVSLASLSSRYLKNLFGVTKIFCFFVVLGWFFFDLFLAVRMGDPGNGGRILPAFAFERVMTIFSSWMCCFLFLLWFEEDWSRL